MKRLPLPIWLVLRTNLPKTIVFNFRMFPFQVARKLPVVFMGKVNTSGSTGMITFTDPVHTGMLILGEMSDELCSYKRSSSMRFKVAGNLVVGDHVHIRGGGVFNIGAGGVMTVGADSLINSYCRIWCMNKISIGKNSRLSWDCQLFDSNFHYMVDDEGYTRNCHGQVSIGDNVWIGNRVTINKGTNLPNYTIVGSGSFVNRDFTEYGERCVVGGSPAKFIKSGYRRLFNYKKEAEVAKFFDENPSENKYFVGENFDEESYTS